MAGRVMAWLGGGIAVAALAGLGVYFGAVGLEDADRLASVIGAFVGLLGLGLTAYGMILARRGSAPPTGERSIHIAGDNSGMVSTGDGVTMTQTKGTASGGDGERTLGDEHP